MRASWTGRVLATVSFMVFLCIVQTGWGTLTHPAPGPHCRPLHDGTEAIPPAARARKGRRPGFPGRLFTAWSWLSEAVLDAQHHRPARHGGVALVVVVLLDGRLGAGAGEVVHVLAGGRIDTGVVGDAGGGVEAVVLDQAPLLVEEVADVHDVQRDLGLVALHEARQFLADADVEAVGPLGANRIRRGDSALVRSQVTVLGQPLEELLLHRLATGPQDVARAGRHVEQVVVVAGLAAAGRIAVAVGVVVGDVAERTAATTLFERPHLGLVVAEEGLLPVQLAGHAVLDRIARVVGHVLVDRADDGVAPVRGVLRAGHRADFLRSGVGVEQRPAPLAGQRLVQAQRQLGALALVGVADQQHVADAVRTVGLGGGAVGAGVDAVAAGLGRVTASLVPEQRTAVRTVGGGAVA